ncbi:MAG TPA: hypothetical protein DCP10_06980 [Bacteroidales bacterium]|nr:hypothetical protein [Bacteroidales bacterium]
MNIEAKVWLIYQLPSAIFYHYQPTKKIRLFTVNSQARFFAALRMTVDYARFGEIQNVGVQNFDPRQSPTIPDNPDNKILSPDEKTHINTLYRNPLVGSLTENV